MNKLTITSLALFTFLASTFVAFPTLADDGDAESKPIWICDGLTCKWPMERSNPR